MRATSAKNDRFMVVMAKQSRIDSAVTLNRDFVRATIVTVFVKTYRNRLRETG